jgi:hypothetical protein
VYAAGPHVRERLDHLVQLLVFGDDPRRLHGGPELEPASARIAGILLCYIALRSRRVAGPAPVGTASMMSFFAFEGWRT